MERKKTLSCNKGQFELTHYKGLDVDLSYSNKKLFDVKILAQLIWKEKEKSEHVGGTRELTW